MAVPFTGKINSLVLLRVFESQMTTVRVFLKNMLTGITFQKELVHLKT